MRRKPLWRCMLWTGRNVISSRVINETVRRHSGSLWLGGLSPFCVAFSACGVLCAAACCVLLSAGSAAASALAWLWLPICECVVARVLLVLLNLPHLLRVVIVRRHERLARHVLRALDQPRLAARRLASARVSSYASARRAPVALSAAQQARHGARQVHHGGWRLGAQACVHDKVHGGAELVADARRVRQPL